MIDETVQADVHQVRFHVTENKEFLQILRDLGKKRKCSLICVDRNSVAGRRHVETALHFAGRSFKSDIPISRSLEVESLLYTAGTRQTGLIEAFGIKAGTNECYLCILPPSDEAEKEIHEFMEFVDHEKWEEISSDKIKHLQRLFAITDSELQLSGIDKITDLILERVALLN
ncbi:MAG TPA: KEOPS complex subunit Cgi121, partial [Methanospirillum sp.]|uniref:KEOPS complex subunit Cgi121 n=1 Tax=Methanospirillum sp. TaxID=45200 RepID=UPI002C6CDC4F